MSRGNGKKRLWRVAVLIAGVLSQSCLFGTGRAIAQAPSREKAIVQPATAPRADARGQAMALLAKARIKLKDGDFAGAEALAKEAAGLHAKFSYKEDSPSRVSRDVARAKTDPKFLLAASRAALARHDYDQATKYARQSEKFASLFTFPMWSDSPARVLKDIETARRVARPAARPATTATPVASKVGGNADQARALCKQARQAMASGKTEEARTLCKQAAALKANLSWHDDNPDRVLADLDRASKVKQASHTTPVTAKAAGQMPKSKADAVALLAQGRKALAEGNLKLAESCVQKARSVNVGWGLFEQTPDSLYRDIVSLRGKRNKLEAAKLLAEGRALHAKGDYEGASRLAYRSQTLYNGYGVWDLGDRPSRLLADCQTARNRSRRAKLPAAALARHESPLPALKPTAPGASPVSAPTVVKAPTTPATPAGTSQAKAAPLTPPAADANKLRARQLVAEAQRLRSQGDLLGARKRAMEAQSLRVAFAADEMSPELVGQQVAAAARRQIEKLTREGTDALTFARGDAAARQRVAEAKWREARTLAAGFMQDTRAIDDQLTRLRPAPQGQPGQLQQASYQPVPSHGQQLLAKARIELQKGEPGTARKMAEEALTGKFGVKDEAMALLRTIDVEEFNQKCVQARRGFDAAEAALRRRDMASASALLASIDSKLLDEGRQIRLREVNMMPGLARAVKAPALTPVEGGTPSRSPFNDGLGGIQRTSAPSVFTGSKVPGRAVASDQGKPVPAGGATLIDEYKQRQTALFQMMRQKGLEAQSQAADKFRAGQHDAAIGLLDDYLSDLNEQKLDGKQVSLLRRPVEARKSQYAVLKSQKDLAAGILAKRNVGKEKVASRRRLEDQKRKNVEKLMGEFNTLFREKKFMEAEGIAMRAREIDPDNEVVTAAIAITRNQRALKEYKAGAKDRQTFFTGAMNDAESMGPLDLKRGVTFDKDRVKENRNRKPWGPQTITRYTDKDKAIERKLMSPVNLNFEATPLKQVIDDLRDFNGINIVPDMPALQERGISLESPITIKLDTVSLKSALNLILHQVGLTYVIKEEVLQITTEENAKGKLRTVTYQVADLVINLDPTSQPQPASINPQPGGPAFNYAAPSPITGPLSMTAGTPVGSSMAAEAPGAPAAGSGNRSSKSKAPTMEGELIRLLTSSISPKSWSEMGGAGTIEFHPLTLALVINQTPDIQEQIQDLLTALRRLQDQTVSVEVRMITVSEDFFERIGVNFAMNILTDKSTRRFEPTLLNGNFVSDPTRFINNVPNLTGLISGVTPAGSLTPSLDIPISQQSFYQTFPTFGNYTGGGLNVGLAFLSDIQVFLFMEALQGDTRANVMQAPKITCANGQSAFVMVSETQNFLTSVAVTGLPGGQFAFVPSIQNFGVNQVTLSVTPLITDDRRFVRMSIQPNLQTLLPGPVPVIPVTVPIFTNLTSNLTVSQPVVFTQFIQTPRIATITVQTEVRIPDGGTVVMGGLKRLAEARTEFGPPVLSKLPYINRLFKNVGYGRETESLLIMVTARIIVLSEEEIRSTGFDSYGYGTGTNR